MIAFLRRRRAQANRPPIELGELRSMLRDVQGVRERREKDRKANRRWLGLRGESR